MMEVISVGVVALVCLMLVHSEWRTLAMKLTLLVLWLVVSASWVYRLYRAGILKLTPGQLLNAKERPKIALVEYIAIMTGGVMTVFLIL